MVGNADAKIRSIGAATEQGFITDTTDYYIEVKRLSENDIELIVWENSDYTGFLASLQNTIPGSEITELDTIVIANLGLGSGTGTMTGSIDDVEIFADVTNATTP